MAERSFISAVRTEEIILRRRCSREADAVKGELTMIKLKPLSQYCGFGTLCCGAMMGENENLVIPAIIILIGVAMIIQGNNE